MAKAQKQNAAPTEQDLERAIEGFEPHHREQLREIFKLSADRSEQLELFAVLLPQPFQEPTAELPGSIERKCCSAKSCGNTALELVADPQFAAVGKGLHRKVEYYDYRRANGEVYFSGTRSQLADLLNDVEYFPVDEEAENRRIDALLARLNGPSAASQSL